MSRVLMAWELGAGMGHMDRMLVGARALRARGHEVRFALKDLSRAHARVAGDGFTMMQSPVWLPQLVNAPRLGNYAAVLAAAGWLNAPGLAGLVTAWRTLFALNRPDVIVCDHAPTAMLAARGLGLPVCAVGSSFEIPPPAAHFPPMAYWDAAEASRCAGYDATLLAPANQGLALLGDEPLARLTDLFSDARLAIVSLPELAHYHGYPPDTAMLGPSYVDDIGATPLWPAGDGPKVFAYLSPTHGEFEAMMSALKALGLVSLVHAKGISAEAGRRLGGPRMHFEPTPVRIDAVLGQAGLVISHASAGTVSAAALAGKPQLVVPMHMEQSMVSRRVVETGIGLAVALGSKAHDHRAMLRQLTTEASFSVAARALAQRSQGLSPQLTGARVADVVEEVLGGG